MKWLHQRIPADAFADGACGLRSQFLRVEGVMLAATGNCRRCRSTVTRLLQAEAQLLWHLPVARSPATPRNLRRQSAQTRKWTCVSLVESKQNGSTLACLKLFAGTTAVAEERPQPTGSLDSLPASFVNILLLLHHLAVQNGKSLLFSFRLFLIVEI